jgi:hypothetical protein
VPERCHTGESRREHLAEQPRRNAKRKTRGQNGEGNEWQGPDEG